MLHAIRYWLGWVMLKMVGVKALERVVSAHGYHVVTHEWTERIQDRLFPGSGALSGCVTTTHRGDAGPDCAAELRHHEQLESNTTRRMAFDLDCATRPAEARGARDRGRNGPTAVHLSCGPTSDTRGILGLN